jgi:hypothetical protein
MGRNELKDANVFLVGYGLDGDLVTCETFPLPKLQYRLRAFAQDLYHGKGLVLLRGLDQKAHSVEDGMVIFLGIQAYIAEQRARQDVRGNMIGAKSRPS